MSTSVITTFFALLALACFATTIIGVGLAIAAKAGGGGRRALDRVRVELAPVGPWLAFAIAAVATAGSLWLSGGAGFTPCTLCWYQRIAMYPLSLILGIAAWRRDIGVRVYAIPLAAVGALVSCYHILVERFPTIETGSCDPNNPCSLKWVEHFGFVTIPTMALAGFLAIITVLALTPSPLPRSDP
jgi:disulfide bond formation protein DsbB